MNKVKMLVVISLTFILSGCAALNSEFECKSHPGVKCKSVDEINAMVNQGHFDKEASDSDKNPFSYFTTGFVSPLPETTDNKKIISVWMAPHIDDDNTSHGAATHSFLVDTK